MEGNHRQTPPRFEQRHRLGQRRRQRLQLLIHRDPQRLEGARRRVELATRPSHRRHDDLGQMRCAADRAGRDDGLRDPPAARLLAVFPQQQR